MQHFIIALVPVLALIFVGYLLKRLQFIEDNVWAGIEKLTYYVMFPALLIFNIGRQNLDGTQWQEMFFVIFVVLAIASLLLLLLYRVQQDITPQTFTSLFQGGIRFNSYIAFSISAAFYGDEGLGLAAISAGFMIVMVNILCVGVFAMFGDNASSSAKVFMKQVCLNPLILACIVGWLLSLSGIGLPSVSADILKILGQAALPIGLMAVGAALKPRLIKGHSSAIVSASILQFIIKPALVIMLCTFIEVPLIITGVLLIAFISPTASSAYILARQLGGDVDTMASIITLQTLLAFIVMPLWAYWVLA
ncbi:AEC family transporter [Glaciecola sp. XM2]|jgi:predicted permease|uniref:AEC family transporter n=1 Tax=Glaciecola sp. XM2 TaxID=1914931 RepID=UPI001BDEEA86|nr:AEC family transporter [Glaciecola sp. XM2]MBT1452058.1 AEC family transporter [Glaciecola sp. XM2]